MEDFKYLPPKYSYALKDLASDYGVFERTDVSSVISGSTNLSMTTASGFNGAFNNDAASMVPKDRDYTSFPLSPIKEQRGPASFKSNSQTLKKYGSITSSGYKSSSNGAGSRFKNPIYPDIVQSKQSKRSKKASPLRGVDASNLQNYQHA